MRRHLLSAAEVSRDDALLILDTARELSQLADRPIRKLPTLRGRTVVSLFCEVSPDSARTRISFEAAAKRLSADVISYSAGGTGGAREERRESLRDTALTLEALGADAVVVRHGAAGAPHRLAGWMTGSVVNAGDGEHEHPTQALADACTIRHRLGRVDGLRVAIVGDVLHSPVARSGAWLLRTLGAEVTLVAPPPLLAGAVAGAVPGAVPGWPCEVSDDLDAALPKADVVMMLPRREPAPGHSRGYVLDAGRLAALQEHAIVLHPGPVNRGTELTAGVADSPRSAIAEQVSNGVSVRMAVLYLLLGGSEERP